MSKYGPQKYILILGYAILMIWYNIIRLVGLYETSY